MAATPRWLVIRGRLQDALEVIHNLREGGVGMPGADASTAEVEAELMELWSAVEKEYHTDSRRRRRGAAAGRGGGGGHSSGGGRGEVGGGGGGGGGAIAAARAGEGDVSDAMAGLAGDASTPTNNSVDAALDGDGDGDVGGLGGFFRTLLMMFKDIGGLFRGDERRAFTLALWLAFFNQACCSTSIINFAPKILERSGVGNRDDAVLFASGRAVCVFVYSTRTLSIHNHTFKKKKNKNPLKIIDFFHPYPPFRKHESTYFTSVKPSSRAKKQVCV